MSGLVTQRNSFEALEDIVRHNFEDRFALAAVFILVRVITEAMLYRLIPPKYLQLRATKIVP